jgi:hypothetical protein
VGKTNSGGHLIPFLSSVAAYHSQMLVNKLLASNNLSTPVNNSSIPCYKSTSQVHFTPLLSFRTCFLVQCTVPESYLIKLKIFFSVAGCHSFCLFSYFFYNIHTFIQSHSYNTVIRRQSLRPLSICHRLYAQWERPPCGAEPGIELGPAFQQADAPPTEPRRTIKLST